MPSTPVLPHRPVIAKWWPTLVSARVKEGAKTDWAPRGYILGSGPNSGLQATRWSALMSVGLDGGEKRASLFDVRHPAAGPAVPVRPASARTRVWAC